MSPIERAGASRFDPPIEPESGAGAPTEAPAHARQASARGPAAGATGRQDLLRAMAKAVAAAPPDLEEVLTPERAVALFGEGADDARARLLEAQGPVRDALAAAIAGPQGKRAAQAYERLAGLDGNTLPPEYAAALVRGVGTPRSSAANGREGILTPIEAQNAAAAWGELSPGERDSVAALLSGTAVAGQTDASPAQALILKALAARRTAFAADDLDSHVQALTELEDFATGIRGLDFATLMQKTSLLDIDGTTSSFDPLSLEDRPGAPAERPTSHSGAANDGLFQRYEDSCGPASIEVLLGELDPAYALRRRSTAMDEDPAASDDIQTQVLKDYGLTPASRVIPAEIMKLRGAMSTLEDQGRLAADASQQVAQYLLGSPDAPKGPLVDDALETIRAANDGFPDEEKTKEIRAYVPPDPSKTYNNIGFQNVAILLNKIVGNELGVDYKLHSLYDQVSGGGADAAAAASPAYVRANLDQLERNLSDGINVVLGTSFPNHFWSISNVQGDAPNRQLLVHDTWSGKTGWTDESKLVDGSFSRAFLGESKTSTFIDLMYLVD